MWYLGTRKWFGGITFTNTWNVCYDDCSIILHFLCFDNDDLLLRTINNVIGLERVQLLLDLVGWGLSVMRKIFIVISKISHVQLWYICKRWLAMWFQHVLYLCNCTMIYFLLSWNFAKFAERFMAILDEKIDATIIWLSWIKHSLIFTTA